MDKPKPDLSTTTTLGVKLPIIADLGDGWFLVAHPNGPIIANKECWGDLSAKSAATLPPRGIMQAHYKCESPVPESVQRDAVGQFEKLAWPLVRKQFYDT